MSAVKGRLGAQTRHMNLVERLLGLRISRLPKHLRTRLDAIDRLSPSDPPKPWSKIATVPVGGLEDIGFSRSSDILLSVSANGAGVFDCTSGTLLARDSDADCQIDLPHLQSVGIGPIAGVTIPLAGLHGGGLPSTTVDGWTMEQIPLSWPNDELVLAPPSRSMLWPLDGDVAGLTKLSGFIAPVRAFGFSPTGRSLVVATSSDITIFGRP